MPAMHALQLRRSELTVTANLNGGEWTQVLWDRRLGH